MRHRTPTSDGLERAGGCQPGRDRDRDLFLRVFATLKQAMVLLQVEREDPPRCTILETNLAAVNALGVLPSEQVQDRFPPEFARLLDREHLGKYLRLMQTGGTLPLGDISLKGPTEGTFGVEAVALTDSHLALRLEDLSSRLRTDRAIVALQRLSARLHSTFDPQDLVDALIEEAISIVGAESGVAAFCTDEGISCFRFHYQGSLVDPAQCAEGNQLLCRMMTLQIPYLTNDALNDPQVNVELAARFRIHSVISTPILSVDREMIGFLELHNKLGNDGFGSFEKDQLAAIAQTAATAMSNSVAYQKLALMGKTLRQSQERYQLLVEGVDAILWEADARSWQFLFISPQAEKILGYPLSMWLKEPNFLIDHIHPEDRDRVVSVCTAAIEKGEDHQVVYRAIASDGTAVWLQQLVKVVQDPSKGTVLRGLILDITERVAADESRRRAEQEVAQLLAQVRGNAAQLEKRVTERTAELEEKNTELKSFAYSVSHDLRAPLRALQGFAKILIEEENITPQGREMLQRILSASERMDALVQDLLVYSRLGQQEVPLTAVSLNKIVEEAIGQLRAEGEKEFSVEVEQGLPEVIGHHAVLTQVVWNLLSNAVKFVAPGVTPQLAISGEEIGDRYRLYLRDNGIGIAPQHQERIFKIFERLHGMEEYPGTGVGLAIARKGVTRMGGAIGVDSVPGKGSLFWIDLKKATGPSPTESGPGGD